MVIEEERDEVGERLACLFNEKFRYNFCVTSFESKSDQEVVGNPDTIRNEYDWRGSRRFSFYPLFSKRNLSILILLCFQAIKHLFQIPNVFNPHSIFEYFKNGEINSSIFQNGSIIPMDETMISRKEDIMIQFFPIMMIISFLLIGVQAYVILIAMEYLLYIAFLLFTLLFDIDEILSLSPLITIIFTNVYQFLYELYSQLSLKFELDGRDWNVQEAESRWQESIQKEQENLNNEENDQKKKQQKLQPLKFSISTMQHNQSMDFAWFMLKNSVNNKHKKKVLHSRNLSYIDDLYPNNASRGSIPEYQVLDRGNSFHFDNRRNSLSSLSIQDPIWSKFTVDHSLPSQPKSDNHFSATYISNPNSYDTDFEGIEVYKDSQSSYDNITTVTSEELLLDNQIEIKCTTSSTSIEMNHLDTKSLSNIHSTPLMPKKQNTSLHSIDTGSSFTDHIIHSPKKEDCGTDWVDVGTRLGFALLKSESVKKISQDTHNNRNNKSIASLTNLKEDESRDGDATGVEEDDANYAMLSKRSGSSEESSMPTTHNSNSEISPYPNVGAESIGVDSPSSRIKNPPPSLPVHPLWTSAESMRLKPTEQSRSKLDTPITSNRNLEFAEEPLVTGIITHTPARKRQGKIVENTVNQSDVNPSSYISNNESTPNPQINKNESFLPPSSRIEAYQYNTEDNFHPSPLRKSRSNLESPIEVQYLSPTLSHAKSARDLTTPFNFEKLDQSQRRLKRHTTVLPGCKMVVPVFSQIHTSPSFKRHFSKFPAYQMATVVSSKRITLPVTNKTYRFSRTKSCNETNCLSIRLQIDKSFLKNGKFAEMYMRIPDAQAQMPRHSCYPIGSCVATSFGIGVVAGWRVEDDIHVIKSLWKNKGNGSACAYLHRNKIHGIIEAGVGFAVQTKLGRGKVLAYVHGGKNQLKGKFFVLIKESGRLKGHVIELNRCEILSCPSAKFIPVIEQIRASARYKIQMDSYERAIKQWDVDMMKPLKWSEEIEILFASLIKAFGENPHFDSDLRDLTASLISFLEDLDIGNQKKIQRETSKAFQEDLVIPNIISKDESKHGDLEKEGQSQSTVWPEPGLMFVNDLFGGIFKIDTHKNDTERPDCDQTENSTNASNPNNTCKRKERDSYDKAYAAIKMIKRALAIAQAEVGSSRPTLRLGLSIISEILIFLRAVIKVREINVSQEAAEVRSRTLEQVKETLYPIQTRMTRVGEGIMARLQSHGTRAKARLACLVEILVKDEKLLQALERAEWQTCFERIERGVVRAKIMDAASCAQYYERFLIIYNSLAPRTTNSEAAALRSGEKIAWFARVMKWMSQPQETMLKFISRDDVLEVFERILVRVFKDDAESSQMINIYAFHFRSFRYFRMLINLEMSGKLWIPFLDAADDEISWAVTRMPDNTKEFVVPLAKLFSLGVASFRELKNAELAANWMNFLMEEPARSFIHDLDMKLVLGVESFCNDLKQTMTILPYYASLDEDILQLLDEVHLEEVLNEMAVAILDKDRFAEYLIEKSKLAVDRFLNYLPKISIPVERRDISDGWVLTCRGKNGGDLTLSEVKIESENLTCRVMGSANVFSLSERHQGSASDDSVEINESSEVEEPFCNEVSILDHVKELLVNAQRYGSWKPGRGGVDHNLSVKNTPLEGIPMSQVLSCAVELWQNLEIDDDELMEIVIRDISYQIQCQKESDVVEVEEENVSSDVKESHNTKLFHIEDIPEVHKKFNPRVDPTLLYLDLRGMTFTLNEFLFRVEPKIRYSVFDPVFEGHGTLHIKNTSIKMRVECRKERIMKLGVEVSVPVLQLQQLDVSLDKVKFKFKDTGVDWLLNKAVGGLSQNITETVEVNLKEQIISQIHLALEHLNAFIEVNPDLTLKVLGIAIDDLEENVVWV